MIITSSLRRLNGLAMLGMSLLILGMAILSISSLRTITRQTSADIAQLQAGTSLGSSLVSSVLGEIRAAEQYLLTPNPAVKAQFVATGDSGYVYQARLRDLPELNQAERRMINQVASRQAELEVAYATAHALADIGRNDEARLIAARAGTATDSLISVVQALNTEQAAHVRERADQLQARAEFHQKLLVLGTLLALLLSVTAGISVIRLVDRQMGRLIEAADRFGGGDLRPIQLGQMPEELQRLAAAMDNMASRLRAVVSAVVNDAVQISGSASDFSAMSEEIAASSGEISAAMVKISSGAEHQVQGVQRGRPAARPPARGLSEQRRGRPEGGPPGRGDPAHGAPLPRRRGHRPHHSAGCPRCGADLVAAGAGPGAAVGFHHQLHRPHQADLVADQPPGTQRRHRGGPGR